MSEPLTTGWPRLTESLPGGEWGPESKVWHCQRCYRWGYIGEGIHAWQEHDDRDRREPRAVVLCEDCSDEVIEPHPRLYRRLHEWEPLPGVMDLCRDCTHRDGYLCTHPDLTVNGGEGLEVIFPEPTRVHVTRSGPRGGRRGSWENQWHGAPTGCVGREEAS